MVRNTQETCANQCYSPQSYNVPPLPLLPTAIQKCTGSCRDVVGSTVSFNTTSTPLTLSRTVSSNTPVVAVSFAAKLPKGLVPQTVFTTSTDGDENCVVGDSVTSPAKIVDELVDVSDDGSDREAVSCQHTNSTSVAARTRLG